MANSSSQLGCNDTQANYELENDYPEFFEKCDYVTSDYQTTISKKRQDDLFVMHFSIRSLQKHINDLNNIIAGFDDKPKIIAISETKLQEGKMYRSRWLSIYSQRPVVPERGGAGGATAPLPFYQEGKGGHSGQYCPLHFSTIVTKQTFANLKARFSKAG